MNSGSFVSFQSIVRVVFHERRLQYMEKEQLEVWKHTRPGERIVDIGKQLLRTYQRYFRDYVDTKVSGYVCWFVLVCVCWFVLVCVCWFVLVCVCWFVLVCVCWFVLVCVCWFVLVCVCWFVL